MRTLGGEIPRLGRQRAARGSGAGARGPTVVRRADRAGPGVVSGRWASASRASPPLTSWVCTACHSSLQVGQFGPCWGPRASLVPGGRLSGLARCGTSAGSGQLAGRRLVGGVEGGAGMSTALSGASGSGPEPPRRRAARATAGGAGGTGCGCAAAARAAPKPEAAVRPGCRRPPVGDAGDAVPRATSAREIGGVLDRRSAASTVRAGGCRSGAAAEARTAEARTAGRPRCGRARCLGSGCGARRTPRRTVLGRGGGASGAGGIRRERAAGAGAGLGSGAEPRAAVRHASPEPARGPAGGAGSRAAAPGGLGSGAAGASNGAGAGRRPHVDRGVVDRRFDNCGLADDIAWGGTGQASAADGPCAASLGGENLLSDGDLLVLGGHVRGRGELAAAVRVQVLEANCRPPW